MLFLKRTFSPLRHGSAFISIRHCDVRSSLFVSLTFWWVSFSDALWPLTSFAFRPFCLRLSLLNFLPFFLPNFRSFWECKGKAYFLISKFCLEFILAFILLVLERPSLSIGECKGAIIFLIVKLYFKILSAWFFHRLPSFSRLQNFNFFKNFIPLARSLPGCKDAIFILYVSSTICNYFITLKTSNNNPCSFAGLQR